MILSALDIVVESTRAGRIIWRKVASDRYETTADPKVCIQFHYPQVGGKTTTGADIVVVSLGGVTVSFFSESDGMSKVRAILRAAFPEWEEHLSLIESRIDEFVKQMHTA